MDLGERYLVLAMRLGRLAPDLVDSYSGPRELAARVGEQPPPTPEQLREEARELRVAAQTETDDAARRRWLAAQLDAIETACAVLDGERIGYRELVHRCHGVRTTPAPEEGFAAAHERLRDALPGPGGARDRYERWLAGREVPAGILLDALTTLAGALRARTRAGF